METAARGRRLGHSRGLAAPREQGSETESACFFLPIEKVLRISAKGPNVAAVARCTAIHGHLEGKS